MSDWALSWIDRTGEQGTCAGRKSKRAVLSSMLSVDKHVMQTCLVAKPKTLTNRILLCKRFVDSILLDKISTYERESDSSPDTLSSMSSDSDLSDSSLYSHFRSRRASPTKAPVPTTSNNKHLRVPLAKETNSSSPVAHHPKKTASKAGGRRSPAVTGRKDHKEPAPASTPSTITNVGSATQKPKRIHNSSKLKPNSNKIRKVQVLEKNEDGSIKFPVTIGIITIMKIGHVVSDREAFHNERYIWPVGYTMSRSYNSMVNPNEQTVYTCSVIDDGEAPKVNNMKLSAIDQFGGVEEFLTKANRNIHHLTLYVVSNRCGGPARQAHHCRNSDGSMDTCCQDCQRY